MSNDRSDKGKFFLAMSVVMSAPCKDCGDRYLGCHDRCERYLAAVEETEMIKRKKREIRETNEYFVQRKRKRK